MNINTDQIHFCEVTILLECVVVVVIVTNSPRAGKSTLGQKKPAFERESQASFYSTDNSLKETSNILEWYVLYQQDNAP